MLLLVMKGSDHFQVASNQYTPCDISYYQHEYMAFDSNGIDVT